MTPGLRLDRSLLVLVLVAGVACEAGIEQAAEAEAGHQVTAAQARLGTSEGGQRLLRAVEAHGGLAAWYGAPTSSYTWEYANVGADLHFKSFLVADNATRRVYHDLRTLGPYGAPRPLAGRFAWDGADAWIYPDSLTQINPRFWATTGYYFEQIPFVLADPGVHLEVLPPDTLDGAPYDMVRASFDEGVGDAPGDVYTLYLDRATGLVRALRYTVTYGRSPAPDEAASPRRETLFYYDDYVTVDGLTVATHFRGYSMEDGRRGDFRNEAWADSISFRRPFDASRLAAPEGARVAAPPGTR